MEELPAPDERWFCEHVELVGLVREPAPAQGRPQLRVVKAAAPADGLLAGEPPAGPKPWTGVRVG